MIKAFAVYCAVILAVFVCAQHEGYSISSLMGQHYHATSGGHGYSSGSHGYHK